MGFWSLFAGTKRKRSAAPKQTPPLHLEVLEDRVVPAIIWENRGTATDLFTPAERAVVDQAIGLWQERLNIPFNLPISFLGGPGSNVDLGPGQLGLATATFSSFSGGLPQRGVVTITSNAALVGRGSPGWYVDPNPQDNAEYTASVLSPSLFLNGPNGADLLTTVTHEIGHVLGFGEFFPALANRLVPLPSGERLFTGNNGFTAVFTAGGGGHLSPTSHPGDLMIASQLVGLRAVPSNVDVRILQDAFGYSSLATPAVPNATVPNAVGTFDPFTATWYLRDAGGGGSLIPPFSYGGPGWSGVTGDWNGDGVTTVGVFDPTTATWFLRNSNSPGAPDLAPLVFGLGFWIPVTGDWNGDGQANVGMYDPFTATWFLRNSNDPNMGSATIFQYGGPGWLPVVGDWNGDGTDTVGVFDPTFAMWYLRDSNSAGAPSVAPFTYGLGFWRPVVGNWDGLGGDSIGMFDPSSSTWLLRNNNGPGFPDIVPFTFGSGLWTPLGGNWTGGTTPTTTGTGLSTLAQASLMLEAAIQEELDLLNSHTVSRFCCCPGCQGTYMQIPEMIDTLMS